MISLLGSLLGFGSSLIGPVLDAWNRSVDQKHELAMPHAQAEVQSKLQDQRLEASIVEADMAEIVADHKEQAATVRKGPQWLAAAVWISTTCGDLSHHRRMVGHQLGDRMADHR